MTYDPNEAVQMYLREIEALEPLPKDEETEIFKLAAQAKGLESERAKKRIIENYLRLVIPIANKYSSSGIARLDLIQYGNIGLMRAVDRFAVAPSGDFAPYASSEIEEEIRKFVESK